MDEPAVLPKPRTGLVIWLILSQLLAVGSLFFWLVAAGFAVMAFDAGAAADAWTFVIAVWAYPVFPLAMMITAWIAFARRKNILSAILSGLSFAPLALLILAMWIQNTIWNLTR